MAKASTAFAKRVKGKGYGHDLLFSLGQTEAGGRIDFTADQVLSVEAAWAQTASEVAAEVLEAGRGLHEEDVLSASKLAGIANGVVRVQRGNSVLFQPVGDSDAAEFNAVVDAVAAAAGATPDADDVGIAATERLGRPTSNHLPGGNIIAADGTWVKKLYLPRLIAVRVQTPGEKRGVPATPVIPDHVEEKLAEATTLDELDKAACTLLLEVAANDRLLADLLESKGDIPDFPVLLPDHEQGAVAVFEATPSGTLEAQTFMRQVKTLFPGVQAQLGKTWRGAADAADVA